MADGWGCEVAAFGHTVRLISPTYVKPYVKRQKNDVADGWEAVLKTVIARYADRHLMRFFRGDAAFAIPELYKTLDAESCFTPSAFGPIAFFMARLRICSSALWVVRQKT